MYATKYLIIYFLVNQKKSEKMKDMMISRLIDSNNRIVLPYNLVTEVFHKQNDEELMVDFFVDGDSVIIKRHQPICVFCRTHDNLSKYKNICICADCLKELIELQK